jgi:peptidoglycan-N-acetylglucosamine deacetylase
LPRYFLARSDGPGPNVTRRRVLVVAAGGLTIGLGALFGADSASPATRHTASGHPAGTPLGPSGTPSAPAHPVATARSAATVSPAPAGAPAAAATQTPAPGRSAQAAGQAGAGQPLYYLDDGPKVIALTIDDGPSPVYTPQVLSLLEKYHVQATFSMIGQSVTYYPSVARDVADAGHTIINHTWDHANLTKLRASAQRTEIARTTEAIHAATGRTPRMFRAPYGAWSKTTLAYCEQEKLLPLDWSVDPADWSRPGTSKIVNSIMKTTRTGSIILEHDGGGNRSQTVAALKVVIPRLLGEGYRFAIP